MSNGLPNTKIPSTNIMVGPMYWMNPINDNGIRRAPAENKMSGIAVNAPENKSKNVDIFSPTALSCCWNK